MAKLRVNGEFERRPGSGNRRGKRGGGKLVLPSREGDMVGDSDHPGVWVYEHCIVCNAVGETEGECQKVDIVARNICS